MTVTTYDGKRFNVPVNPDQIKAIYFTKGAQNTQTPSGGVHIPSKTKGNQVFSNWNHNACGLTDRAVFALPRSTRINMLNVWYSWRRGETQVKYKLIHNGKVLFGGVLKKGSCDPHQRQWCESISAPNRVLPKGTYTIRVQDARICQNAGSKGNGFVIVSGIQQPGAAAAPTAQSKGIITGKWDTNWGSANVSLDGDKLVLDYDAREHGKMIAKRIGQGVYQGRWAEDKSDKRCATVWNGRHYWGTVVMKFTNPENFEAQWGYCERARNQSAWRGHKVK